MKKEEAFDREKIRILNELVNGKQEDVCPKCSGTGHIGKQELTEDKLGEIFWGYLQTVTFAHDNRPNEPHKQVIFKEDIPRIIRAILTTLKGDKK